MKPILGMFLVLACLPGAAWSADERAMAVIDKAIKAMGGQEKLERARATFSKSTYKVLPGGKGFPGTVHLTIQGLENRRQELETVRNGQTAKTIFIWNGDQGWMKIGGGRTMEMKPFQIAISKQANMPELLAARPNVLKSGGFEVEWAGEQRVGDRPTVVLKVTGQDAKSLRIFYDKERGLPIKVEARIIATEGDSTFESFFSDYKDFDGIKVATKVERQTDGKRTNEVTITEFKVLDKVPPDTFTEPK